MTEDGPMTACEPQCAMQDTKESDLKSLESKTAGTIVTSKTLKVRLRNILAKLKNAETCEDSEKEEQSPSPSNRLGIVENGVRRIDNEIADMNAIAETLEGILG